MATALGVGDEQLEARGVDVADLDMGGFRKTQAAADDGHEESAGGADLDELLDLPGADDAGRLGPTARTLDDGDHRLELAAEESFVEGAQGVDAEVDRRGGELTLGEDAKLMEPERVLQ